jgi:stalled ribosome rescue protein Dom34
MTQPQAFHHAVIWADHHSARILPFDAHRVHVQAVRAHEHATRQHGSDVRTEHEFMGEVCDTLEGIPQVLVCGSHTVLADLRHYVDKHRPQLAARVVAYEVVDHLSDNELVALARKHFLKLDTMGGSPGPSQTSR